MDKIKKILSPGSKKDDEVMYGDVETRRKESLANTSQQEPAKLYPTEGAAGTEQTSGQRGVGEKLYPNNVEGENQAHYPGLGNAGAAGVASPNTKLETDPNQKDHTVLRQILNPSGNKRDDVAFGTTAHSAGDKGISETGRSDHLGSSVGAGGASSTFPDRTFASENTSSNRESSVAGVSSGHGAPIIVGAAASTTPQYNEPQSHVLDRSHPLRDGSGAATGHINPVGAPEASMVQQTAQTEGTGMTPVSHINPVGAPSTANATLPVMTGAATTGGLAASSQSRDHSTLEATSGGSALGARTGGATYTDNYGATKTSALHPAGTKLDCDGNPVPGYVHHAAGPHSLDMANILDPNVSASPASPVGATTSSYSHPSAGIATGTSGQYSGNTAATGTSGQYSENSLNKEGSTSHSSVDHEKKEKTGLLQKILHPKSHKEEKEVSQGHGHPSTMVDDHGRNVLHKDPPSH